MSQYTVGITIENNELTFSDVMAKTYSKTTTSFSITQLDFALAFDGTSITLPSSYIIIPITANTILKFPSKNFSIIFGSVSSGKLTPTKGAIGSGSVHQNYTVDCALSDDVCFQNGTNCAYNTYVANSSVTTRVPKRYTLTNGNKYCGIYFTDKGYTQNSKSTPETMTITNTVPDYAIIIPTGTSAPTGYVTSDFGLMAYDNTKTIAENLEQQSIIDIGGGGGSADNYTLKFEDYALYINMTKEQVNSLPLRFTKNILRIGGGASPSWQDIVLSGTGSLTLTNAKENGLNYVKLFGACTQADTPTPTTPVDIVCNNGAIKYSANIANVNEQTALVGYYISAQGVLTADTNNWIYQAYIPVEPSTTYSLSFDVSVYYVTISEYSTDDDSGFIVRKAGSSGSNTSLTITTEATTNYIRFGTNINRSVITLEQVLAINWMLNKGNIKPYAPYSENGLYIDGTKETVKDSLNNTATAENLFAVGTVKDVQEVLTGTITHNIGIKVLDGTESWQLATGTGYKQFYSTNTQGIIANSVSLYSTIVPYGCTANTRTDYDFGCYSGSNGNLCFQMIGSSTIVDLTSWTTYLTTQYDNGTPVIVVYPLATATTSSVTGQTLTTKSGSNIIEITQASINNLPLEVSYKGTT